MLSLTGVRINLLVAVGLGDLFLPKPSLHLMLVTSFLKIALPERFRAQLEELARDDIEIAWYEDAPSARAAIVGADVMWFHPHLPVEEVAALLEAGERLRWMSAVNAGVNGWPLHLFAERRVALTNGAGLHAIPMSEYVVMGMLALVKRFADLVRGQDRKEWIDTGALGELSGRRVLIFGYGQIGREIAQRLRGFQMEITGVRRRPAGEPGVVGTEGWERLIPSADFLIITAPLTDATRAVVGSAQLGLMKPTAWIINVARGGLVDEAALTSALKARSIAGAYLDVTEVEPLPATSELWALPNVLISPHSSASTTEFESRAVSLFKDNLLRFRSGEELRNLVDLEAGY